MDLSKNYAPNANSTMRLTYGNVLPYSPKDATYFDYQTTLNGLMQKEDPSNPDFTVDPTMKELWKNKDYGRYANKKGDLIVNFLTNNDITGGNSGSPCINADGELIGVAFDGNWEAMSGDIFFEPNIQRTIVCDMRYVLWIIDKCYGAQNLIDEMEIRDRPSSNDDEEIQENKSSSNKTLSNTLTNSELFNVDDVLFEVGKYDINDKNVNSINQVIKILTENSNSVVELDGHADLTGDVCKNLILSEKRAKSVQKYLVSKGIDSKRIITKGFGTAQPKDENKTETGRAHNRRVTFLIK